MNAINMKFDCSEFSLSNLAKFITNSPTFSLQHPKTISELSRTIIKAIFYSDETLSTLQQPIQQLMSLTYSKLQFYMSLEKPIIECLDYIIKTIDKDLQHFKQSQNGSNHIVIQVIISHQNQVIIITETIKCKKNKKIYIQHNTIQIQHRIITDRIQHALQKISKASHQLHKIILNIEVTMDWKCKCQQQCKSIIQLEQLKYDLIQYCYNNSYAYIKLLCHQSVGIIDFTMKKYYQSSCLSEINNANNKRKKKKKLKYPNNEIILNNQQNLNIINQNNDKDIQCQNLISMLNNFQIKNNQRFPCNIHHQWLNQLQKKINLLSNKKTPND